MSNPLIKAVVKINKEKMTEYLCKGIFNYLITIESHDRIDRASLNCIASDVEYYISCKLEEVSEIETVDQL